MTDLVTLAVATLVLWGLARTVDALAGPRLSPRDRMWLYLPVLLRLVVPMSWTAPTGVVRWTGVAEVVPLGGTGAGAAVGSATAQWPVLELVWAVGAGLLLARMARQRWRAHRRVVTAPRVRGVLRDALGPAVVGVWRPVVVMPADGEPGSAGWRAAWAHEQAHIRARDPWLVCGLQVGTALCWPLPAVWLTAGRLRQLAELAADGEAAAEVGARAVGRALLDATPRRHALAFGSRPVRERIRALRHPAVRRRPALVVAAALATSALSAQAAPADVAIRYEVALYEVDRRTARTLTRQLGLAPHGVHVGAFDVPGEPTSRPTLLALPGQDAVFAMGRDEALFEIGMVAELVGDDVVVDLSLAVPGPEAGATRAGVRLAPGAPMVWWHREDGGDWLLVLDAAQEPLGEPRDD